MSNSLDSDQALRFVGPDHGANCLPRLSADDTGRQRVKNEVIGRTMQSYCKSMGGFGCHGNQFSTNVPKKSNALMQSLPTLANYT